MAKNNLIEKLANTGILRGAEVVKAAQLKTKIAQQSGRRAYQAAQVSRLTSSMATQPKPADSDIRSGLRRIRARSREEAQNNDYVKGFLRIAKNNIIGAPGILMQGRVVSQKGNADKGANKAIQEAWKEWGKHGTPDVTGKLSWKTIQRLYVETLLRDGEILIRKIRNWKRNAHRFALQFLDVEVLDVEYNRDLGNGRMIRMGVELDEWRRPVAYHLLQTKDINPDCYAYMGRTYLRVPANEIIHEFLPEWVWQTRGVPLTTTGLLRMNMLEGYEEAELVASRFSSSKMGAYEQVDEMQQPLDGDVVADGKTGAGEFLENVEPGTIGINPPGYKLTLFDPQHPNSAYKDFVKACLRGIATGLGVSYNSLANDLEGVNYNSLRKGALDDQDIWMALQEWVIETLCDPVYAEWLPLSLLAGAITTPNGASLPASKLNKYKKVTWQPRRWQWVDPLKMMAGHEKSFQWKINSPQRVIRETGQDPETVLDEWAEWKQMLETRGLSSDEPPETNNAQTEVDEDAEEDNEDNEDNEDSDNDKNNKQQAA